MNWSEYFSYKDGWLYWKIKPSSKVSIGDKCQSISTPGYIRVRLNGKCYQAHRIIYEMHYGRIPELMEIDHINHDRADNKIENLRIVTVKENRKNQSRSSKNSSGVTGVSWHKGTGKWLVRAYLDGSKNYGGLFIEIGDAIAARNDLYESLGFHKNHGDSKDE